MLNSIKIGGNSIIEDFKVLKDITGKKNGLTSFDISYYNMLPEVINQILGNLQDNSAMIKKIVLST